MLATSLRKRNRGREIRVSEACEEKFNNVLLWECLFKAKDLDLTGYTTAECSREGYFKQLLNTAEDKEIRYLNLANTQLLGEDVTALRAFIKRTVTLKTLVLKGMDADVSSHIADVASRNDNITEIYLSGNVGRSLALIVEKLVSA